MEYENISHKLFSKLNNKFMYYAELFSDNVKTVPKFNPSIVYIKQIDKFALIYRIYWNKMMFDVDGKMHPYTYEYDHPHHTFWKSHYIVNKHVLHAYDQSDKDIQYFQKRYYGSGGYMDADLSEILIGSNKIIFDESPFRINNLGFCIMDNKMNILFDTILELPDSPFGIEDARLINIDNELRVYGHICRGHGDKLNWNDDRTLRMMSFRVAKLDELNTIVDFNMIPKINDFNILCPKLHLTQQEKNWSMLYDGNATYTFRCTYGSFYPVYLSKLINSDDQFAWPHKQQKKLVEFTKIVNSSSAKYNIDKYYMDRNSYMTLCGDNMEINISSFVKDITNIYVGLLDIRFSFGTPFVMYNGCAFSFGHVAVTKSKNFENIWRKMDNNTKSTYMTYNDIMYRILYPGPRYPYIINKHYYTFPMMYDIARKKITKIGYAFNYFEDATVNSGINFPTGLTILNGYFILSMGESDSESILLKVKCNDILKNMIDANNVKEYHFNTYDKNSDVIYQDIHAVIPSMLDINYIRNINLCDRVPYKGKDIKELNKISHARFIIKVDNSHIELFSGRLRPVSLNNFIILVDNYKSDNTDIFVPENGCYIKNMSESSVIIITLDKPMHNLIKSMISVLNVTYSEHLDAFTSAKRRIFTVLSREVPELIDDIAKNDIIKKSKYEKTAILKTTRIIMSRIIEWYDHDGIRIYHPRSIYVDGAEYVIAKYIASGASSHVFIYANFWNYEKKSSPDDRDHHPKNIVVLLNKYVAGNRIYEYRNKMIDRIYYNNVITHTKQYFNRPIGKFEQIENDIKYTWVVRVNDEFDCDILAFIGSDHHVLYDKLYKSIMNTIDYGYYYIDVHEANILVKIYDKTFELKLIDPDAMVTLETRPESIWARYMLYNDTIKELTSDIKDEYVIKHRYLMLTSVCNTILIGQLFNNKLKWISLQDSIKKQEREDGIDVMSIESVLNVRDIYHNLFNR